MVAGRRPEPLEAVVGEIESMQGKALAVPTDVGDPESVEALFAEDQGDVRPARRAVQQCRVRRAPAPIEDLNGRAVARRWSTSNVTGTFLCTQQAFRIMKDQTPMGGRIINNGSISAHVPRPNSIAYTPTKHAVTGLTKSTSLDGRKYDIACGQIDIGNALTEMTQRMTRGVPQPNGEVMIEPTMDVEQRRPLGRAHGERAARRPTSSS